MKPDWLKSLEDQYVTQGESLTYFLPENTNIFGKKTTVKFKLGEASLFARYDPLLHAFIVDGDKVDESNVGLHKITGEATYVDPKN